MRGPEGFPAGVALSLGVALAATACGAAKQLQPAPEDRPEFRGIGLRLEETAHDGQFEVPADAPFAKVDANGVLKLVFDTPDEDTLVAIPEDWRDVDALVRQLGQLQSEYVELSRRAAELPPQRTAETEELLTAIRGYDARVVAVVRNLAALIGPETVNQIVVASVQRDEAPLVGLARYIEDRKDELERRAALLAAEDSFEVAVRAYLLPRLGEIRQLHVPEYDVLPSRPFQPISRVAPIPTEAEVARLTAELQGAEAVKASIREIKANDTVLRDHVGTFLANLTDYAQALIADLDALVREWTSFSAEDVLERLGGLGTAEAGQLRTEIIAFRDDVQTIGGIVEELSGSLSAFGEGGLAVSAQSMIGLQTGVDALLQGVETVGGRLGQWGGRLDTIGRLVPLVLEQARQRAESALALQLEGVVTELQTRTDELLQSLKSDFPQTMTAVEVLKGDFLKNAGGMALAASSLAVDDTVTIPRPLDDLVPAVLDLRRTGIAPGDVVEVHVGFLRAGSGDANRTEKSVRYSAETVLTGWHREFSADVVFVQALSGEASNTFTPEVGISTEWHYFKRPGGGFLNSLDPGVGFHAVNLDQGTEAVEIGLGVNASLWGGLLRSGVGVNLMVDEDRGYWWIGFGLIGALNRVAEL